MKPSSIQKVGMNPLPVSYRLFMRKPHGNSNENENDHHLYEIWDSKEEEVYKYGISDDPIDEDGLSRRIRSQLALFNNLVNWVRFVGRVLIKNIPGRKKARELEQEHIEAHKEEFGEKPRGNRN